MVPSDRGGDHGYEEARCEEEGGGEARGQEGVGEEARQEDGQEVVLAKASDADPGLVSVVGVGRHVVLSFPEGMKPGDLGWDWKEQSEDMRTVLEVSEAPYDLLRVSVVATVDPSVDRITLVFDTETMEVK